MFLRVTDKYYVSKLLILRAHAFTFFVVEKKRKNSIIREQIMQNNSFKKHKLWKLNTD